MPQQRHRLSRYSHRHRRWQERSRFHRYFHHRKAVRRKAACHPRPPCRRTAGLRQRRLRSRHSRHRRYSGFRHPRWCYLQQRTHLRNPPHYSFRGRNCLGIVGDGLRDRGHNERQYQAQHGGSAQNACQHTARRFITLLRFVRIRFHRCLLPKRPRSCSFTIKRICAICNCARLVMQL